MPRRGGIGTGDYQIAELSVGLELDLEELNLDAAVADKTVSEMITKLNHRAKQLEIRAEIDLTNLENAGTEVEKLQAKESRLNEILDIQRKKLQLLKEQYEKASNDKDVGVGIRGKLSNRVLLQELEVAKTESALRGLAEQAAPVTSAFSTVNIAAAAVGAAIGKLALEVADLIQYAARSGQEIEHFAEAMGTTAHEARELSIALSLGGVSNDTFTHFITTFDKRIQSTGKAGEMARENLQRFGVTLQDGEGRLVSYSEQLERLAEGYQNAKAAGRGSEFITFLGPGAEAVRDVLGNYEEMARIRSRMAGLLDEKSTEEFVAQSKELDDRMKELNLSIDQIKVSLGAAFLPFVTDIAPMVNEAVNDLTVGMSELSESVRKRYKNLRFQFGYTREEYEAAMREQAEKEARDAAEAEQKKAEAREKIRERELGAYAGRISEFNAKIQDSLDASYRSELENRLSAIGQQAEKYRRELEAVAKEFHTEPDKDTLALIDRNAQAQKERVIREFSEQTASYLDGIYETSLQRRLNQIEREKEAWVRKGLDEVRATEAAEEQKRRAVNSSVIDALTRNKKYLDVYRKMMSGSGKDGIEVLRGTRPSRDGNPGIEVLRGVKPSGKGPYAPPIMSADASLEERQTAALEAMKQMMLRDAGIDPGDRITAAQLQGFQQIFEQAKNSFGLSMLDGGLFVDRGEYQQLA